MRPSLRTMLAALLGVASSGPVVGPTQTSTRPPSKFEINPFERRELGARAPERRRRQGLAGTGGPWHARHDAEVGDPRCGCSQCVRARREALRP